MGPNGSGKSTLAYSIAGHPKYQITGGTVTLDGDDVLAMTVDERARAGLFLAMQYPVEVPGVSVANFLRTAKTAIDGEAPKLRTWAGELRGAMEKLQMDPAFAQRNVNEGFSGGEKKRHEIMQLELLKPKMAILDETDSGLDIDALRVVSEGVNRVRATGETGLLLITHYTRILRYIKPDFVHVFVAGKIVQEGGPELAEQLEAEGYERYVAGARPDVEARRRMTFDVAPGARRLPDPGPGDQRAPAGLPGQRQHLAEAAAGARRHARALRAAQRATCPGRCTRSAPRRPTAYEGARAKVAAFIGAPQRRRGRVHQELDRGDQPGRVRLARPAADLLRLGPGDEIVISEMEHHSNIVPWQLLCERTGATLRWFGVTDDGPARRVDAGRRWSTSAPSSSRSCTCRTSSARSTTSPRIVARAHEVGALVMLDCSQSVPHLPVDVAELGVDFIAFTGHKMLGPTGIGVLWGRAELLEAMPPFLGGGSMIETVTMAKTTFAPPPARFEAGTPPIAEAIGLGAAVDYLTALGMARDPRARAGDHARTR